MSNAQTQIAARSLDIHCKENRIQALIGLSEDNALVVYAQNRKAFRMAKKMLPDTWMKHPLKVVSYSKARASTTRL